MPIREPLIGKVLCVQLIPSGEVRYVDVPLQGIRHISVPFHAKPLQLNEVGNTLVAQTRPSGDVATVLVAVFILVVTNSCPVKTGFI
jgi:hypothetical protein